MLDGLTRMKTTLCEWSSDEMMMATLYKIVCIIISLSTAHIYTLNMHKHIINTIRALQHTLSG